MLKNLARCQNEKISIRVINITVFSIDVKKAPIRVINVGDMAVCQKRKIRVFDCSSVNLNAPLIVAVHGFSARVFYMAWNYLTITPPPLIRKGVIVK